MEAFHGVAGRRGRVFEKNAEGFRRICFIEPEVYVSPFFSIESYNDASYYPLNPLTHNKEKGLVALLSGYLWHDDVEVSETEKLQQRVMEFCERITSGNFVPPPAYSGIYNLVVFDAITKILYLTPDSSGLYPVYFAVRGDELVFASHLHLLARSINASLDDLGVLETATLQYTLGERTLYEGVYRLSPGQTLVFDTETNRIERVNHQEHFQSISDDDDDKLAEQIWDAFVQACKRIGKGRQPIGVMLSGGLDSRMVIAGMQASGINAIACTHGQEGFHEVSASRKVAQLAGVPHHLIPMEKDSYIGASDELERVFWTSDTTLFPVWRLGGNLLKERGATAVTSGYCLDATLGGHFHDVENPRLRFIRRLKHAIRKPQPKESQELFRESYLQGQIERIKLRARKAFQNQEHFFHPEFYGHLRSLLTKLSDDLSGETERIRESGTQTPAKVWERFLCENHARKFSFSQELIARSYLPMVVPSYDRALISLLTSMNPVLTLDHCLYFKIIRRFARAYAGVSWSSTAMPITYPIIVNELSRAGRNRYDQWANRRFIRSDGKMLRSRYGAMDYEAVARQTGNLESLQLILNSNGSSRIMDGNKIQKRIDEIRTYKRKAFNMTELTNLVTIRFAETLNYCPNVSRSRPQN